MAIYAFVSSQIENLKIELSSSQGPSASYLFLVHSIELLTSILLEYNLQEAKSLRVNFISAYARKSPCIQQVLSQFIERQTSASPLRAFGILLSPHPLK